MEFVQSIHFLNECLLETILFLLCTKYFVVHLGIILYSMKIWFINVIILSLLLLITKEVIIYYNIRCIDI